MQKILHFISGTGLGGPKSVFLSYNKLFEKLGCDFIPIVRKGSALLSLFDCTSSLNNFATCSYPRFNLPILKNIAVNEIIRLLEKYNPGIIYLHKPIDTFLWRLAVAKLQKLEHNIKIPKIILVVHGFQNRYLEYADFLIAVSLPVLEHLLKLGYKNVFLINNFINHDVSKHKISWGNPIQICAMGYFRRKKGFTDFLSALSYLKEYYCKFDVRLFGYGTLKPLLHLLKYVYNLKCLVIHNWSTNIREIMREADIIVIPSRSESFGMVVIEAMAQGALVIATRSGGPQHIIEDGKTGILVDVKEPKLLAAAILNVVNNPTKWTAVREAGRQMVQEKYTMSAIQHTLEQILSQIRS